MKRWIWTVVLMSALMMIGCATDQKLTSLEGMPSDAPVNRIQLTGENCTWSPDLIRVRRGDHVILDVTSVDWDYNFRIKGYDLKTVIPQGQTKSVEFYASRAGDYEFGCYIEKGQHYLWGGMVGKLIVD